MATAQMPASYPAASYAAVHHADVDLEAGGGKDAVALQSGAAMLRLGFIRKVMGMLSAQLLLTAAIAAPIVGHPGVRAFVTTSSWILPLSMLASLVLVLVLSFERVRHSHPHNLILLAAFTAVEGVLVGAISSQYQLSAVLLSVGLTAAITVGLAAYALTTKTDFTMQGGLMVSLLLGLLMTGLLAAFTRSSAVQLLLACGGALLFSAFIVYDVQLLAGSVGDRQAAVQLSPDEYVVAALQIYLDVVQLFLHLLRLVSEMQRN